MKHGRTHPQLWFWYCTVCISMAGPCRADTTNPARGSIYESIAYKIMEMSALITHTIQFFFYLHRRSFGREAVRNSTFPWKNWPKYFLSKKPHCVFIIRWMAFYMVLTFSSVHFVFSLSCLFFCFNMLFFSNSRFFVLFPIIHTLYI